MATDVSTGDPLVRATLVLRNSPILELRDVAVEQQGEKIVLKGVISSFYYKQLSQEAVRSVVRNSNVEVLNLIGVRGYPDFDRDD